MGKCALKYRKTWLILAGVLGMCLAGAFIAYWMTSCFVTSNGIDKDMTSLSLSTLGRIVGGIALLLLSLPTLFLLWFFRTHDTKEQIRAAQENINVSNFHKGVELVLKAKEGPQQGAGIIMLYELSHKKNLFEDNIKAIIQITHLSGIRLRKAQLENITFLAGKNLREAMLQGANLRGANLRGANLTGAKLRGADLTGADLTGAKLQGADLTRTNLTGADLTGADLTRTNLTGAILIGADLTRTNLTGAILIGTNLQHTNKQEAILQGAIYNESDLEKTNL